MRKLTFLFLSPIFAAAAQGWLWKQWSPKLDCIVYKGTCVYQWDPASSVYFESDMKFGLAGLLVGLLLAVLFGRRLWRAGALVQASFAIWTTTTSYLAARVVASTTEFVDLGNRHGVDALELRSISFVAVSAFVVQLGVLVFAALGPTQKVESAGDFSD